LVADDLYCAAAQRAGLLARQAPARYEAKVNA
jgi:hypothetical protein